MEIDKNKTCCFTGHRFIKKEKVEKMKPIIRDLVNYLYFKGFDAYVLGGALGFDTICAKEILSLRDEGLKIKVVIVSYSKDQSILWKKKEKDMYNEILKKADYKIFISEKYSKANIFKRNRYLVDSSSVCICYLEERYGGTSYTVGYAFKNKLNVINVYPMVLEDKNKKDYLEKYISSDMRVKS